MTRAERQDLSDEELMKRLAQGDTASLGDIYVRYGKMVGSALARFAPELSKTQLEDLCQDVFIVVNEAAKSYVELTRFRSWLYGIAVKKALKWRRDTWLRRKLLKKHAGENVAMAWTKDTSPEHATANLQQVFALLEKLSAKHRSVLLLQLEGFSGEEIAEILGIETQTVWTRLHRARQMLLECADKENLSR
jgi:RNA polymerase sigma-70 factor (ECF subfamily)